MNRRIWIWHNNDWARITLPFEEKVVVYSGGPHCEGYSYTSHAYYNYGNGIKCEVYTNSRDCDGRFESYTVWYAKGKPRRVSAKTDNTLGAMRKRFRTVRTPRWVKQESSQRDYTAESMGY